jgi:glycosyltransferase involved in cell wall biosynthesis
VAARRARDAPRLRERSRIYLVRERPRVLLDARKARDFGIGRALLGLLSGLVEEPLELVALVKTGDEDLLPPGVEAVLCDAPAYGIRELFALRLAIRRLKPDLFHAPHYVVPISPPRRTVVTIHDLMHLTRQEHGTPPKRLYARVMLGRAVEAAARILTPSEATRRELIAFDARAGAKSVVIPNAVDPRFLVPRTESDRARVRSAYGLESRYVLFAANDKPHKNLEGLLAAFARFARRDWACQLVLAGGATSRKASRLEAIERHGLLTRVRDVGVVPDDDLIALMAEAHTVVVPSLAEGFGLPVLEAYAVGTPVVSSNRGALPEVAGDAALLVEPQDADALAGALLRVTSDDGLRRDLVARGRERAARFSAREMARRTADVYREVLEEPH